MTKHPAVFLVMICSLAWLCVVADAQTNTNPSDSRGADWTQWINVAGEKVWGKPPPACDDWTFARRVYLDVLGRPPSVAELRDYEAIETSRRRARLVDLLVFADGPEQDALVRQSSRQFARQWHGILLPNSRDSSLMPSPITSWLAKEYRDRAPLNETMRRLIVSNLAAGPSAAGTSDGAAANYFAQLGGLPENYAGNLSRVMLGVRIECAQCHDHPFSAWKMEDFWGIAAYFSGVTRATDANDASKPSSRAGEIQFGEKTYRAKLLWDTDPAQGTDSALRQQLGRWMTAPDNPNFSATMVNRMWQQLVGRGLFADVENLDTARPEQRQLLDEFGQRFAADGFDVRRLTAAICKSHWYQAISQAEMNNPEAFYRPLKSMPADQVFDSLEQSLHLPISRIDANAPRWTGAALELINRLNESGRRAPDDYAAGIPQALLLMNGRMTSEAISTESSRLLRAVIDSPFLDKSGQVETLYLAILSRRPTVDESRSIEEVLSKSPRDGMSNLVWALVNSPEFVLCR